MKKKSQVGANAVASMVMKKASQNQDQEQKADPTQIALYQTEIELLKKRVATLSKTRTAWMATSIILFAMFVITLGLKLA
ncbi:MAG: hypothetical protein Q4A59_03020 [Erysipelotrichaceae bacterium]|nr:hypothetical protein [Erysipelotrichaceae bacterium]